MTGLVKLIWRKTGRQHGENLTVRSAFAGQLFQNRKLRDGAHNRSTVCVDQSRQNSVLSWILVGILKKQYRSCGVVSNMVLASCINRLANLGKRVRIGGSNVKYGVFRKEQSFSELCDIWYTWVSLSFANKATNRGPSGVLAM